MKVWHYTQQHALQAIFDSGELRPDDSGDMYRMPFVWFSEEQDCDKNPASVCGVTYRSLGVRFGLDLSDRRLMPWELIQVAAVKSTAQHSLLGFASNRRNLWHVVRVPVPLRDLTMEIWSPGGWCQNLLNGRIAA